MYILFSSIVNITGLHSAEAGDMEVDEGHVDMEGPFSQSRIGNESNPFVGSVDVHAPTHVDSDDEQEFVDRLDLLP